MEETKRLLDVLNDSSSYAWGEVGTFISDKKIIFYDMHNQIVGYTDLYRCDICNAECIGKQLSNRYKPL